MWWDTPLALLIVAAAALYVVKRLFLKPHCGPGDGCRRCASGSQGKLGTDPKLGSVPKPSNRPNP
jgi:hypothetical protein